MPDTTLTTLAVATGGAFLGKFVGPAAEHYGKLALERAQQLGAKATNYLAAVGREPQPVEPKLLLPMVQAAALESDPDLADKWAALLANSADPTQKVMIQPGFAEVLRQLMSLDAQILAVAAAIKTEPKIHIEHYVPAHMVWLQFQLVDQTQFYAIISNLMRLGLLMGVNQQPVIPGHFLSKPPNYSSLGPGIDHIRLTRFGSAFLTAVTPPTP